MAGSQRVQRVADTIQRELAALIQLELRDPRVGMVSITGVDVSRDFSYARVHVTVMKRPEPDTEVQLLEKTQAEEAVKALNKAAGFLRSLLSKRLKLRTTPKLQFHYDESIARGRYLSDLINDALDADRKRQP